MKGNGVFIQQNMQRQRKLFLAKTAVVLGAIPVIIWAHEYGPDAGYCNVPKELGTCLQAGCHVGTLNGNTGSVKVNFPGGLTYSPGVKQHLTVTISDSATTQKGWGFQLSARTASSSSTMAGTFNSDDPLTTLMCASVNLGQQQEVDYSAAKPQTCLGTLPLEYMEHSLTGYNTSAGQTGSYTYQFDWTPPATNVGNVIFYVAANAGPGNPPNQNNAHVYTTTYTLTPATATGTAPAVTKVVSASGFGGFPAIAPGQWIEISGTNLAPDTRIWTGDDFSGVNAPTSLDGVKVTIGGQSAFVYYISSVQVNALVPSNVATGSQQLTVTNGTLTSSNFNVTVNALEPGLLALPQSPWLVGSKQYVVAQTCDAGKTCTLATDLTFILPTGTSIPGYPVRPAKPGETLTIYGIGFGPAHDSSNLTVPVGQIVGVSNQLVNPVTMQVNGVPATLAYSGMAPSQVGLFQFNLVVPTVPDGDWPLTFTQNGTKSTQTLLLSVHQ